jgi:RING finger protein 113A
MSEPVVTFKKAPRRPNQSRKRSASPVSEDPGPSTQATSSVIRPTKKSILNPLVQGTKRRRDPNEQLEDGEGGLDDFDYKADEGLTQKGDAFATRSTDYDLESMEPGRPARVKLNEVSLLTCL